jgi:putative radical SAM enzyme (TIGR03279 family)
MDTAARVVAVAPGSPADLAGIAIGDELLALNGEVLRDVVRYQILADEAHLDLELRRGGLETAVRVAKQTGQPLGLELESAVFDRVRTCDNHCPFCFIYQLPPGMRRSLSLKDDDYRLSFLYGNFTTLTRFTEADLERVVDERMGPLYVSIHATDPDIRAAMLRNRRGATSLRWLRALLDHGIEVHGQVVLCPGVNDGGVLDDTLLGVLERFPEIASLAVVPIGVSAHNREPTMRALTADEAGVAVATVEQWQARFLATMGRRVVHASDELYLVADTAFPRLDQYDGLPQHENGVGMARAFEDQVRRRLAGEMPEALTPREGFFAWSDGAEAGPAAPCTPEGYRAPRTVETPVALRSGASTAAPEPRTPRPVAIVTGEYGARVLDPLIAGLSAHAGVEVRTLCVPNRYFGGNIAVSGLLTATDVASVLADEPAGHRYLLPDVVLSRDRFLDDGVVSDLPLPVEVVVTDGAALVDALASP